MATSASFYLRRRRQELLWKLLQGDVVEGLPPFAADPVAALKQAVAAETGAKPELADPEVDRLLALEAIVSTPDAGGTRFAWAE